MQQVPGLLNAVASSVGTSTCGSCGGGRVVPRREGVSRFRSDVTVTVLECILRMHTCLTLAFEHQRYLGCHCWLCSIRCVHTGCARAATHPRQPGSPGGIAGTSVAAAANAVNNDTRLHCHNLCEYSGGRRPGVRRHVQFASEASVRLTEAEKVVHVKALPNDASCWCFEGIASSSAYRRHSLLKATPIYPCPSHARDQTLVFRATTAGVVTGRVSRVESRLECSTVTVQRPERASRLARRHPLHAWPWLNHASS